MRSITTTRRLPNRGSRTPITSAIEYFGIALPDYWSLKGLRAWLVQARATARARYRDQAKMWHPDRACHPGQSGPRDRLPEISSDDLAKFVAAQDAWEVVSSLVVVNNDPLGPVLSYQTQRTFIQTYLLGAIDRDKGSGGDAAVGSRGREVVAATEEVAEAGAEDDSGSLSG